MVPPLEESEDGKSSKFFSLGKTKRDFVSLHGELAFEITEMGMLHAKNNLLTLRSTLLLFEHRFIIYSD